MKKFELKQFYANLPKNEFVKKCPIPLGYRACLPIVRKRGDHVLLIVPFNKVQKSKTPGVSAVFPIAYTVTFELFAVQSIPEQFKTIPEKETGYSGARPVGFETLAFSEKFEKVDFGTPIDRFPHQELLEIGEEGYREKVCKMYETYDAIINDALGLEKAAGIEKLCFRQTLSLLTGPVTKQLYRLLDPDFYERCFTN